MDAKKTKKKKLSLNKETIRTLRDMELENIVAGSAPGGTGPCPDSRLFLSTYGGPIFNPGPIIINPPIFRF